MTVHVQQPHAFHVSLPEHHRDVDGIPFLTKYAQKKVQYLLQLLETLELDEVMFLNDIGAASGDAGSDDAAATNTEAADDGDDDDLQTSRPTTWTAFARRCSRLQSQLSSLESLKYSGLTRMDLSRIVLRLLRLLTATVTYQYHANHDITSDFSTAADHLPASRSDASLGKDNTRSDDFAARPKLLPIAKVTLHYENVGYIHTTDTTIEEETRQASSNISPDTDTLHQTLQQPFALPSPARETILSILISILSNKGPLRSVSNASIYPQANADGSSSSSNTNPDHERFLLIIHWRALLRMLLRTAPYLNERTSGTAPMSSNTRQSTILKRTVHMIRDARHFFDQGIRPPQSNNHACSSSTDPTPVPIDDTAVQVWDMVATDIMYHSHTHACYRSLIMFYLFQPTRCSSEYYLQRLPLWLDSWSNIDRCPEIDFLWLALFCRARKHLPPNYDWGPIRRRILTHAQYWLLLPIGGVALDKSFPRASAPRSRSCPSRLKAFTGSSSSYEEGIDFVAKVAKLLAFGLGTGKSKDGVSEGSSDVLRFLSFVAPYYNPSNIGAWTFTLGAFLHYFSYEICCRIGVAGSMRNLRDRSALIESLQDVEPSLKACSIPAHEIVLLLDKLLPLCQQSLYSKNLHVSRAGEASMLYFAQIDPARVTPSFIDFAIRALDISAVNLAHQAPAAISALTRLLQPAMRRNPAVFLAKLPDILRLSLAGIDSNDQNKTIRTLILYRSLTSWFAVGNLDAARLSHKALGSNGSGADVGNSVSEINSGTRTIGVDLMESLCHSIQSPEYLAAVDALPESSLLKQGSQAIDAQRDMGFQILLDEASSAMYDWALEFLDRIFALLRATGEREKAGKTTSRTAARHANVDAQQANNFSRVLRETLLQTFASMSDEIHKSATQLVTRFLSEETLPSAAKDAAYLCEALAASRLTNGDGERTSPGMKALAPILMDDLQHCPTKTCIYRIRCLAGAIRLCGHDILTYRKEITRTIDFALQSKDKHLYKTGCKLLRHTLAALCETRPEDIYPQIDDGVYGRSAQLRGQPVTWYIPKQASVEFAFDLIHTNVYETLQQQRTLDIGELRRLLRRIRYVLRGSVGILLDADLGTDQKERQEQERGTEDTIDNEMEDVELFPYESAVHNLLTCLLSRDKKQLIVETRGRIAKLCTTLMSLIASQTFKIQSSTDEQAEKVEANTEEAFNSVDDNDTTVQLSRDTKICKEATDIALLLLTRRGASFRAQEGKTIWKAQKQVSTDFPLLALADHTVESLQRAQLYGPNEIVLYKDGEDAGKTLPRRLLVNRTKLFHNSLQRTASFEVPRRLRRLAKLRRTSVSILFSTDTGPNQLQSTMKTLGIERQLESSMDLYEGLIDGLFSLCCHPNTQVRASSIGVVEYAITRFGWLIRSRVPRLLAAIRLDDNGWHGKFGVPSCAKLLNELDSQGKRKRLSEVLKGTCAILATPRPGKHLLSDDRTRCRFIKTICGTDNLVALVPPEEVQKMVHYLHNIFSPFRVKFYSIPRSTVAEQRSHEEALQYLLALLSEKKQADGINDETDAKGVHWRKLLMACYFLTVLVDSDDLRSPKIAEQLWSTCFQILENEHGQPLQRVGLGLFGRMVMLAPNLDVLRSRMVTAEFCKVLSNALVYDHKEDTSIGGGHDAQWSTGVADFIRDSARNIAPKTLFPFQRTGQSSGTFKVAHSQLIEHILGSLGEDDSLTASRHLLEYAKELASAPPSEDQRNQQCTVAELFAGICRSTLRTQSANALGKLWISDLLPFLDDVYPKLPTSVSGAFFDSVRFSLQFLSPARFYPMTSWLFDKVEETLWQPAVEDGEGGAVSDGDAIAMDADSSDSRSNSDASKKAKTLRQGDEESSVKVVAAAVVASEQGTEGFTAQSKWLYLCSALLVELDEMEADTAVNKPWYSSSLTKLTHCVEEADANDNFRKSWALVRDKLLPKLTNALGHPYESCRDHISGCLFRICHCHRKMLREDASRSPSRTNSGDLQEMAVDALQDPGIFVVDKLLALKTASSSSAAARGLTTGDEVPYKIRFNSLNTVRRFFSYCIHLGEAKHEYSDYLISLLPLAFDALGTSSEGSDDSTDTTDIAKRSMESDVVKGYRYTVAEMSVTPVISYGDTRDISRVLNTVEEATTNDSWQVRHAAAHFLRCFQGGHKFIFSDAQAEQVTSLVASMLADERREVSSAAMAAITGILAASPADSVEKLVKKYVSQANKSRMKRKKGKQDGSGGAGTATRSGNKKSNGEAKNGTSSVSAEVAKEKKRAKMQQTAVYFLCASVLAHPYDTPSHVPVALAAISKHSFERCAPLSVRETVKRCCAEYKRTHMSDNWELHRRAFTQEQLEALEDVVSSPHYYA